MRPYRGRVSVDDVRRLQEVLAIDDPGARNYAITRTYWDLARRLDGVLGTQDANWLTFGTWASASAGRFIRQESLPVGWGVEAVAAGNAAIITDIAPRFVAFLDLAREWGPSGLAPAVASCPELTATAELAESFECYARAAGLGAGADDDTIHAELMLRANTLIAHHEQRLADVFVDRALPLSGHVGTLATLAVTLSLPEGEVRVSHDVAPPSYLGGEQWPAPLRALRDPRLVDLARAYGQDVDSARRSNATSWEDFDERMGYIFCFFRAYQRDPALRSLPPDVPL